MSQPEQESEVPVDCYTVGWICALQEEYECACRMLDEEYSGPNIDDKDDNTYAYGRIAKHYVVIGCLPAGRYGTSSAARVARDMVRSFPRLRFALMVGIGGGAPTEKNDIRLGDVVVSQPTGTLGGVAQYDLGKQLQSSGFQMTGQLNTPPEKLLGVIPEVRRLYNDQRKPDRIAEHLRRMDDMDDYRRPMLDRLYKSEYQHVTGSGKSCEQCVAEQILERPERRTNRTMTVHYGNIASGNTVLKDATIRDSYAKDPELNILCFEMEAAGLMNNLPCLVIRGICDYCDSHKNDDWHKYAALVAAAYARELLLVLKPQRVEAMPSWAELVLAELRQAQDMTQETNGTVRKLNQRGENEERRAIADWLTPVDYAPQQSDYIAKRQEGTGEWVLESNEFQTWLQQSNQILFCPGIPGAGKTIITSIIVDHLHNKYRNDSTVGIAYVYCNFRQQHEQKSTDLILSLLKQFIQEQPSIAEDVRNLYEDHHLKRTRPSHEEILRALQMVIISYSRVFIIVDALDECEASLANRGRFLPDIFTLQAKTGVNIFATSRFNQDIEKAFHGSLRLEIRAARVDIEEYLNGRLLSFRRLISEDLPLREEIKSRIAESADGMFLLAQLYVDSLAYKTTSKAIRLTLNELHTDSRMPDDDKKSKLLDRAYEKAMERIKVQPIDFQDLAMPVLSWITFAKRPLRSSELQHAIAIETDARALDEGNIPNVEDMVSVCAGLVTVDPASDVVRLVHYTTQEYFERMSSSWFPYGQQDIARSCITYLSFDCFENGPCGSLTEYETRTTVYSLYEYAADYWGDHAKIASDELKDLMLRFLMNEGLTVGASQAMMNVHSVSGYGMTGIHFAAHFGLEKAMGWLLSSGLNPDPRIGGILTPLSLASARGHDMVARMLLTTKQVDPEFKSMVGETPLSLAARYGHQAVVELLIETAHVDVNAGSRTGMTPLLWAVINRHEKVTKVLLDAEGIDVNSKDIQHGRTPLSWAASIGHEVTVKLLLATESIEVDYKDPINHRTPLSLAAENGHEGVVQLLLDTNAVDLDCRSLSGLNPLSWACRAGQCIVARILLNANSTIINSQDKQGWAPLSWSAERGHQSVVELLLEYDSINPNIRDLSGQTPLSLAAARGHIEVVKILMKEHHVDPDAKDNKNDTPLAHAAHAGHRDVVAILLDRSGVNPDPRNKGSWTPLALAAHHGYEDVVQLLLQRSEVNPNGQNSAGSTALSLAVRMGKKAVVELLLRHHEVDPNLPDQNGRTPLSWAAETKGKTVAKLLLQNSNVNPDLTDKHGRTPLSYAAHYGRRTMVELLLQHSDVNPEQRDNIDWTPLTWAAKSGKESVVELLLQHTNGDRNRPENNLYKTFILPISIQPKRQVPIVSSQALDFYWACSVESTWRVTVTHRDAGLCYMSSPPIGYQHLTGEHPVRRVTFTITSKDQDWSNYSDDHGFHSGSCTWFEASVRNENSDRSEMRRCIVNNVHATQDFRTHIIRWNFDAEDEEERTWVRSLRRGQAIDLSVWAAYRYWENHVASAKMEIITESTAQKALNDP